MQKFVSFFEIPASDFNRAVDFYQSVFDVKLDIADDCETEKMGFFPNCEGAVSHSKQIKPCADGVLISLATTSIEKTLAKVVQEGGKTVIPKTAIDADGKGFFAVFADSEGNSIGLHEK